MQTPISNFDWPKAFRNKNANENCKLLTPEWMNALIISALKERSLLVKRYYRTPSEYIKVNPSDDIKVTLLNQANEYRKLIVKLKQYYTAKMSSKLDCPGMTSKTFWSIINRFSNKKDTKYIASP